MKHIFLLTALLLPGCQSSSLTYNPITGVPTLKRTTVFYQAKVESFELAITATNGTKGTLKLHGYVNDQAQMLGAAVDSAVKAAIGSVKP